MRWVEVLCVTFLLVICGDCNGNQPASSVKNGFRRESTGLLNSISTWKNWVASRLPPLSVSRYASLSPEKRLGTTPLFFIGNTRGNSYMQDDVQSGQSEKRALIYFMSSEDGNDFLDELSQSSAAAKSEMRLCTTTMEKVMEQIRSRKQSRKYGRLETDFVIRVQPSSRQYKNAEKIIKRVDDLIPTIPMFAVDGLVLKRRNGELLSPYYFAYEDLLEDWNRINPTDAKKKKGPNVRVVDFAKVMCLCNGGTLRPPSTESTPYDIACKTLQQPAIVPPRREIEMLRKYYRNEGLIKNEFSKAKILK